MFMTSAPSRFPASSNEDWVRVEASKNRLTWVRPRKRGPLLVHLAVELDIFLGKVEQAGNIGSGKSLNSQQMPVTEDEGRFRCRGH